MNDKKEDPRDKPQSGHEFLQIFKRGVQFTEELITENERLRFRLVQLEEENRALARQVMAHNSYKELLTKLRTLEDERGHLLDRFEAVETENRDYLSRYQEIEAENDRLANLYIASYQLHSTLELEAVMRITSEIIINLIGSMDFAVYTVEDERLVPIRAQGRSLESLVPIPLGEGVAGRAARDGVLYLAEAPTSAPSQDEPKACVPLKVGDRIVGLVVLYNFLPHKSCITELDRELFKLLGAHAATAVYSACLQAEVERAGGDPMRFLHSSSSV